MLIESLVLFAMVVAVQVVLVSKFANFITDQLVRETNTAREIAGLDKSRAA
jgi:hypothetical protein